MYLHINDMHPERCVLPSQVQVTKGCVQHFFKNSHGFSYFQVDSMLEWVKGRSDFNLFFPSTQDSKLQKSPSDMPAGRLAGENWDESPFLTKTTWLHQVRGYSHTSIWHKAKLFDKRDARHLRKILQLSVAYLKSLNCYNLLPYYTTTPHTYIIPLLPSHFSYQYGLLLCSIDKYAYQSPFLSHSTTFYLIT